VYHLVSEGTVEQYRQDIADEIEPQIKELILRAEKGLQALQKEAQRLEAKLQARQSRGTATTSKFAGASKGVSRMNPLSRTEETAAKTEIRRLRMQVKHREHLEAELEELQAELGKLGSL
jgi:DASH complex subunit SPC19